MWHLLWGMVLALGLRAGTSEDPRRLYFQGVGHFQKKGYAQAERLFQRLLPFLQAKQQKQKRGSRAWHLVTLGQCDVLYFLARIAWHKQKKRRSCRLYQRIARLLSTVPAGWHHWNIQPDLPDRLRQAQKNFARLCPAVPALVYLKVRPSHAIVFRLQKKPEPKRKEPKKGEPEQGKWERLPSHRLEVRQQQLTLRVQAPQYKTKIWRNLPIPRWQVTTLSLTLQKRPRPRVSKLPPRRPLPPPPPPWYTTWWFWTATGVVVAGGTTAVILLLTAHRQEILASDSPKDAFHLWK